MIRFRTLIICLSLCLTQMITYGMEESPAQENVNLEQRSGNDISLLLEAIKTLQPKAVKHLLMKDELLLTQPWAQEMGISTLRSVQIVSGAALPTLDQISSRSKAFHEIETFLAIAHHNGLKKKQLRNAIQTVEQDNIEINIRLDYIYATEDLADLLCQGEKELVMVPDSLANSLTIKGPKEAVTRIQNFIENYLDIRYVIAKPFKEDGFSLTPRK